VRILITLLMLCSFFSPALLRASDQMPPVGNSATAGNAAAAGNSATVDVLLERAIAENLIAGGVVVIGNHDGIISTSAKGQLNTAPGSPLLDERTVFDVASLTKVIATTPAVMKLLDEGKIRLDDLLSRWFPEFADTEITVLHLLTHTSGLSDVSVNSEQSMHSAISKAAAQRQRPGTHFSYADINFILLGELVQRVTGATLDQFCQDQIYRPLGTQETMFLPPRDFTFPIAPTSGLNGGVVQDPNARRLGGVAGHAGLFSSAYDLSRYARLILGRGMLDNQRILSEQVVAQMTTPYLCNNGRVIRGLGWDIASPFSAPKGSFFSGTSFGHTGYSGSSIWIDPAQDLFVILLTRRVNYRDTRSFNQLRRDVSTFAVADLKMPELVPGLTQTWQEARVKVKPVQVAEVPKRVASSHARKMVAKAEPRVKLQRAHGRSAKAERMLAKAGAGRRAARVAQIARVAKSERCKTTPAKKKRILPKS